MFSSFTSLDINLNETFSQILSLDSMQSKPDPNAPVAEGVTKSAESNSTIESDNSNDAVRNELRLATEIISLREKVKLSHS